MAKENAFNKAADKLVERGFAKRIVIHSDRVEFSLTPIGVVLFNNVQELFGVPARDPASISANEIATQIHLILQCPMNEV